MTFEGQGETSNLVSRGVQNNTGPSLPKHTLNLVSGMIYGVLFINQKNMVFIDAKQEKRSNIPGVEGGRTKKNATHSKRPSFPVRDLYEGHMGKACCFLQRRRQGEILTDSALLFPC